MNAVCSKDEVQYVLCSLHALFIKLYPVSYLKNYCFITLSIVRFKFWLLLDLSHGVCVLKFFAWKIDKQWPRLDSLRRARHYQLDHIWVSLHVYLNDRYYRMANMNLVLDNVHTYPNSQREQIAMKICWKCWTFLKAFYRFYTKWQGNKMSF